MKLSSKIYLIAVVVFAVLVGIILTAPKQIFDQTTQVSRVNHQWKKINKSRKIRAITHNNSTGYFIFKGRPMGFHYEMLKTFSKEMGYDLEIIVEDDLNKALRKIQNGKAEILAVDLTLTRQRRQLYNLTEAIGYNHQVLLQRKKSKNDTTKFINDVLELEGQTVYIQKGTIFKEQLTYLQDQTGVNFTIVEDPIHTMEDLIVMVSEGKINYTACDERPAKALQYQLENLDHSLIISPKQRLCWAIPQYEDSLLIVLNRWLIGFKATPDFEKIERKYFYNKKAEHHSDNTFQPAKGGSLTPYDEEIKKYASMINWDWRLLASLIYQESRFTPETESWAGAIGLMQLMPETARRMGVEDASTVEGNLLAGVRYIQRLENRFKKTVTDSAEVVKFVLAAYNCGHGHIEDAQTLAAKYGKSANLWEGNTADFLIKKSEPKYYHDKVVKHGYFRGKQTVKFVDEILERYNHYRNLVL